MSRGKKLLIGAGLALVIAVFVVLALRSGRQGGTEVRTERVERRDLVAQVTASGRIRPHRMVDIQADVSGRIVQLNVEEGDSVAGGDTLLIIDRTSFEAAVQSARAQLSSARASATQAKANLDQAARALDRTRRLKQQTAELISDEQLEAAETNHQVQSALYEAAEFGIDQAQAGLREAVDRLSKTVITAPMSGQVTRLNVDEGETAIVGTMNNPGTVLLTVGDLAEMEAVLEVDETDVPRIHAGDSTALEIDAFPDRVFTGRVTTIGSSSIQAAGATMGRPSAEQSVDFEVVVRLDHPPPELRPDLSATADVVTDARDSTLSIPIIALTLRPRDETEPTPREREGEVIEFGGADRSEDEGVFVVTDDDTVEFRPVRIGIAGRDYFEIVDGLEEGEIVVAGSYQAIRGLRDGTTVNITSGPAPGTSDSGDAEADADVISASRGAESDGEDSDGSSGAGDPGTDGVAAGSSDRALTYSVLIASFRSYDEAVARQREWARADLPVYIAPTLVEGEPYNRVLAGMLSDRDAAVELMERLAAEGLKDEARDWDVRPARYAFELGSFDAPEAAAARVAELNDRGIPAYVVRAGDEAGDAAYRVYAGGYEDREDARPLIERLEEEGLEGRWVERSGLEARTVRGTEAEVSR